MAAVLVGVVAAAGSATSTSNPSPGGQPPSYAQNQAPPPQHMSPENALGLWRSTFGAVRIEADASRGGLAAGAVQGIWVYQRQGEEVVGYFSGNLRGNVLQFRWQEPNHPPLTGEGWLVFDPHGRQYTGRWWSDARDRVGDWNGWRSTPQSAPAYGSSYGGAASASPHGSYGGEGYGGVGYGGAGYAPSQPPSPYAQPQQPPQPPPPPPRYY